MFSLNLNPKEPKEDGGYLLFVGEKSGGIEFYRHFIRNIIERLPWITKIIIDVLEDIQTLKSVYGEGWEHSTELCTDGGSVAGNTWFLISTRKVCASSPLGYDNRVESSLASVPSADNSSISARGGTS